MRKDKVKEAIKAQLIDKKEAESMALDNAPVVVTQRAVTALLFFASQAHDWMQENGCECDCEDIPIPICPMCTLSMAIAQMQRERTPGTECGQRPKLYMAAHHWRDGVDTHHFYALAEPTEEEIVKQLSITYDPDRSEYIEVRELSMADFQEVTTQNKG